MSTPPTDGPSVEVPVRSEVGSELRTTPPEESLSLSTDYSSGGICGARNPAFSDPTSDEVCDLGVEIQAWDLKDAALVTLTVLAAFYTLYFTRALLFPIVLAFIVNLVLKPIILRLQKWRVPTALSAACVMSLSLAVVAGGVWLLWDPAARWVTEAQLRLPAAMEKFETLQAPIEQIAEVSKQIEEATELPGEDRPVQVESKEDKLGSALNITGGFLGGTMIVLVLVFFLLAGGDRFLEKIVELMPNWRDKRRVVAMSRDVQYQISSYLLSITIINALLGLSIGLGLYAIGIPEPALWGTLAALLNYIPFAGAIVGAVIVFLVGLISMPSIGGAMLAPLIYLSANAIEANFITPVVLGKSISLNPVILILSVFFWGWLWGIGGVLLAVPLLVVLKISFDHSPTLKPLGMFLAR
ncbi:AI-2E family transporter [Adhaeretor mobilis]|uniref:AI-2 transport protein TqsA n=1 Tax=Adhaeretor mobilis TaxID=1930276 RepID=A0A517N1T7_9BACT|nr:AI-2E family transporter [Adhaeretor mobilis]QDT01109.1 AI-2 transport protein TqsA [Adhaeretor mobilis]